MSNSKKHYAKLFAVLGIVAFLGFNLPAEAQDSTEGTNVTDQQCRSAWSNSDVTWHCTWNTITANDDNQCVFNVDCEIECGYANRCRWKNNSITVSLDDVDNLRNCAGTLKISSC